MRYLAGQPPISYNLIKSIVHSELEVGNAEPQVKPPSTHEPSAADFALLMEGFKAARFRSYASDGMDALKFKAFLSDFTAIYLKVHQDLQAQSIEEARSFGCLLSGYKNAVEDWRKKEEATANEFNLLKVLDLVGKETRHSMVLAWMLDQDILRSGTHAQGSLAFRFFLTEFDLPTVYAHYPYWVHREVSGNESRVDIEIAMHGKFIIHIENKIWSKEGKDQTDREWTDLQLRAHQLNVPASEIHALFLTPSGAEPRNPNFRSVAWGQMASVFDQFANHAKPLDVKLFAAHYAKALRRFIVEASTDKGA